VIDDHKSLPLLPSVGSTKWYGGIVQDNNLSDKLNDLNNLSNQSLIVLPSAEEIEKVNKSKMFIGPSKNDNTIPKFWKRFGAILVDQNGERHFAKVITDLSSIEEWAKINNYTVERSFRIYSHVDYNKEKTEII